MSEKHDYILPLKICNEVAFSALWDALASYVENGDCADHEQKPRELAKLEEARRMLAKVESYVQKLAE